jgi:hypothetical protein
MQTQGREVATMEHTEENCFCNGCVEAAVRDNERRLEAIAAYESVSRYLNGRNGKDLVQAVARDHRTLQQAFTGFCVAWLEHLSALPEGQYDLRNAASVDLAKAITATKEWEDHSRLPYI